MTDEKMSEKLQNNMDLVPNLSVEQLRREFLDFFIKKHKHTFYKSCKVIPYDDPTLLFINAGMTQFKPIFLGHVDEASPLSSLKRVVNYQKCIRAGGKHNDLDDVGKDVYHHTFFEMLGNWSFGDYFKEEAIEWAWDLLHKKWNLPKERLYVTYFNGDPAEPNIPPDHQALNIWKKYLPANQILPFGCKENFWEMGDVGPCGPCSEIHFDRVGNRDASSLVNQDDPDVLEIWNIVFMQFNRESNGTLTNLPSPCVDTGMGLERITSILQRKTSNYDTDIFRPIMEHINKLIPNLPCYAGLTGEADATGRDMAYRVVADHIRTLTIAISDGCLPSNEGPGYVIRRILRRAVRYGRQFLGASKDQPWLFNLVDSVISTLSPAYPEITLCTYKVKNVIKDEEALFGTTLDKGVRLFNRIIANMRSANAEDNSNNKSLLFPGKVAFQLYTTYGFPLDLTQIMANEIGYTVDIDEFNKAFEVHQRLSENEGFKSKSFLELNPVTLQKFELKAGPTQDSMKYSWNSTHGTGDLLKSQIQIIWNGESCQKVVDADQTHILAVVLDKTQFYAEGGGQVSDTGFLASEDGTVVFNVTDVRKIGKLIFHIGYSTAPFKEHDTVNLHVDFSRRMLIARNHTATHALNFALRQVLKTDCHQKGSLVESCRARFDYQGDRPLTDDEIENLESIVNNMISKSERVYTSQMDLNEARNIQGVQAVFGEAYPNPVNVVSIGCDAQGLLAGVTNGNFISVEFCGGTHVHNTNELEDFVVLQDESVSRGVRRLVVATSVYAKQARQFGNELRQNIHQIEQAPSLDGVTFVKAELKKKDKIPLIERKRCLELITQCTNKLLAEAKIVEKKMKKEAECLGKQLGEKYKDENFCVYGVGQTFNGSTKVLQNVVSSFHTVARKTPFLLVSHTKTELLVIASSPQASVNAHAWVVSTLSHWESKTGGKETLAQGVVKVDGADEYETKAIQYAVSFANNLSS